ncbi:hypothetical protein MKX01_012326 [Papaver californicum]|nr:hypothetical protein MKX01_012326 [Papaver californicum]
MDSGVENSSGGGSELQEQFKNGYISETMLLWDERRTEWLSLSSIPELFTGLSIWGSEPAVTSTSDNDDQFTKWQEEVRKAELGTEALKHSSKLNDVGGSDQLKDLEGDVDERPSTPPDGEEEFTDDDGTIYKWDRGLRAWVPQVSFWMCLSSLFPF